MWQVTYANLTPQLRTERHNCERRELVYPPECNKSRTNTNELLESCWRGGGEGIRHGAWTGRTTPLPAAGWSGAPAGSSRRQRLSDFLLKRERAAEPLASDRYVVAMVTDHWLILVSSSTVKESDKWAGKIHNFNPRIRQQPTGYQIKIRSCTQNYTSTCTGYIGNKTSRVEALWSMVSHGIANLNINMWL